MAELRLIMLLTGVGQLLELPAQSQAGELALQMGQRPIAKRMMHTHYKLTFQPARGMEVGIKPVDLFHPGGFGTLDEALEVLTLIQTGKSPLVPVVLLDAPGGGFWQGALDFIRSQLEANRYILPTKSRCLRRHPLLRLPLSLRPVLRQVDVIRA